jgi:hypothetical protein
MTVPVSVKVKVKYGLRYDPSPEQLQRWLRSVDQMITDGLDAEVAGREAAFDIFPDVESCFYGSEADNIQALLSALSANEETDHMTASAAAFLKTWIADNVHNIPGLEDLPGEVRRLRERLVRDATDAGISVDALEEECGDLDDALTSAYENVHDPELGFRD